jgi:hypothetical protein
VASAVRYAPFILKWMEIFWYNEIRRLNMKKRLPFFFLLLIGSFSVYAQSMPFRAGIFDIDIIQHSHMTKIDNKQSQQIDTHYSFTDRGKTYELRYSLFRQTENNVRNIREVFSIFSTVIIRNIAGYEIDSSDIIFYDDNDVKNEFNGDFGMVAVITDPVSDYGNGYIMLEMFYKNNTGIVARTILSKDGAIFLDYESQRYDEIYHSFRFKD